MLLVICGANVTRWRENLINFSQDLFPSISGSSFAFENVMHAPLVVLRYDQNFAIRFGFINSTGGDIKIRATLVAGLS